MPQSNAERQAAYRERKRKELEEEGLPERQVDEAPSGPVVADVEPEPGERDVEGLLRLSPSAELTPEEEQLLREHFGYSSSEGRTRAQRDEQATRAMATVTTDPSFADALTKLQEEEDRHASRTQVYRDSLRKG